VPPLGQRDGSALLECQPVDEGAFRVEVILDLAVQRGEFLQTSHPPEAEHRPFPPSEMAQGIYSAPPDLAREVRPEPVPPEPDRFMREVDPPPAQQVVDSPQRQRNAHVHHCSQAGDLGCSLEIAEDATSAHAIKDSGTRTSRLPSDRAEGIAVRLIRSVFPSQTFVRSKSPTERRFSQSPDPRAPEAQPESQRR